MPYMLGRLGVLAVELGALRPSRCGSTVVRLYLQMDADASGRNFISVSATLFGGGGALTGHR